MDRGYVACIVTLVLMLSGQAHATSDPKTPHAPWDEPVYFNIPRTSLAQAAREFGSVTGRDYELPANGCLAFPVGPIRGHLTPRAAWHRLLAPTCLVPRVLQAGGAGYMPYRESFLPDGSHGKEYTFQIPHMPFGQVLKELSKQSNVAVIYVPFSEAEEQVMVGPFHARETMITTILYLINTSKESHQIGSRPMWADENAVAVEPRPFNDWWVPRCDCGENFDRNLRTQQTVISTARAIGSVGDTARGSSIIIDRRRIEETGVSSVPELLQYLSQTAFTWNTGSDANGAQRGVNRGIGPVLVTIGGRRTMPSANSLYTAEFDLTSVPLAAVERLEVLPDSGSTIYGLDAIGGIINIVLRDRVEHTQAELRYGTAQGGARERQITLGAADEYRFGRASVLVDVLEIGNLIGAQRSRYANQDYRRFGGPDRRSTVSVPGNFYSIDGQNLPGLSSPSAAIPPLATTDGTLSVDDLLVEENRTSLGQYRSVAPARTKLSIVGTAQLALGSTSISGDAIYTAQDTSYSLSPPAAPGFVLAADHPQNPFGSPVLYKGLLTGIPSQQYQTTSEWLRVVLAARGDLMGWAWELSLLHSRESVTAHLTNMVDPFALMRSLGSPDPNVALNILSPSPGAELAGLVAPRVINSMASSGSQIVVSGKRAIAKLPAGDVTVQLGGEWRAEVGRFSDEMGTNHRDMNGVFAQLRVPLLGEAMVPGVHELSLLTGGRLEDYEDVGSIRRTQHGLRFRPLKNIEVRAGRSELFDLPSLVELHVPQTSLPMTLRDSLRDETVVANVILGGRPDLQPTTAVSTTFGVEIDGENGWKVSADYWSTAVKDRIAGISEQLVLAHEPSLLDRIYRAAPTAADIAAGVPGRLQSIDARLDNLGSLSAAGVDVAFEHPLDVLGGRLTPRLSMTRAHKFRVRELPVATAPSVNRVGVASDNGTITRYRAVGSAIWESGPLSVSGAVRYTPNYRDSGDETANDRWVSDQWIFDVNASARLGSNAKVMLGVLNLFNREADYVGRSRMGYDTSQADMRLRFVYGSVQFSF